MQRATKSPLAGKIKRGFTVLPHPAPVVSTVVGKNSFHKSSPPDLRAVADEQGAGRILHNLSVTMYR